MSVKGIPKVRLVAKRAREVSELLEEEEESSNILPILDEPVRVDAGDGNEASSSVTQGEWTEPGGVEGRYGWASSGTPKGVVHIILGATGDISLCKQRKRGGQPLNASIRGDNLGEAMRLGRPFCVACLAVLPQEAVIFLKENASEFVKFQLSQLR